jgi:hypothetical protein
MVQTGEQRRGGAIQARQNGSLQEHVLGRETLLMSFNPDLNLQDPTSRFCDLLPVRRRRARSTKLEPITPWKRNTSEYRKLDLASALLKAALAQSTSLESRSALVQSGTETCSASQPVRCISISLCAWTCRSHTARTPFRVTSHDSCPTLGDENLLSPNHLAPTPTINPAEQHHP